MMGWSALLAALLSTAPFSVEQEPNDTPAQATPLTSTTAVRANIFPAGDIDYYSFTAATGDRVYAFTATTIAADSDDTVLTLYTADGVTVIESDDDSGGLGPETSTIASTALPANGTYYISVSGGSASVTVRPYVFFFELQHGTPPMAQTNTGFSPPPEPLPASGWIYGAIAFTGDSHDFQFSANAGDTVYIDMDLDPDRDRPLPLYPGPSTTRFYLGWFNGFGFVMNPATTYRTLPGALSLALTVANTGTYDLNVDTGHGPFLFDVATVPGRDNSACATYTNSTAIPMPVTATPEISSSLSVDSTMMIDAVVATVSWGPGFADYPLEEDLQMRLVSPEGTVVGLFDTLSGRTGNGYTVQFDEEAAYALNDDYLPGIIYQPQARYRMHWFAGEVATGTWQLIVDDKAASDSTGGSLNGWSVILCPRPTPASCGDGSSPEVIYATDFEADDGGFTHTGTLDSWALGTPASPLVTGCHSGTQCWKTNLNGTYPDASSQDLFSPDIDLTGFASVSASWWQKHQLEDASLDHASVDAIGNAGASRVRLFEFTDPTMADAFGVNATVVPTVAGWSEHDAKIDAFAGTDAQLQFHLDANTGGDYEGLVIDDVVVSGCRLAAGSSGGSTSTSGGSTSTSGSSSGGSTPNSGGSGVDVGSTGAASINSSPSPAGATSDESVTSKRGCNAVVPSAFWFAALLFWRARRRSLKQ
jgi:subtilisin-like proprotein convertase family protein